MLSPADIALEPFTATVWVYQSKATWYFVTVPKEQSERIKFLAASTRGWGSVRITATIGETTWQTSVFPDSKSGCYVLPLKAAVRKAEQIGIDDDITVRLELV